MLKTTRKQIAVRVADLGLIALFGLSFMGIQQHKGAHPAKRKVASTNPAQDRSAEFRDLLLGSLDSNFQSRFSAQAPSELVFLSDPSLLHSANLHGGSSAQILSQIGEPFKSLTSVDLFRRSQDIAPHPRSASDVEKALESVGKDDDSKITVVVVPGVFGEFIKTRAFEEVFAQPESSFRKEWLNRVAQYKGDPSALTDSSFSMSNLEAIDKPIQDLLSVSSIDRDGHSLMNMVLFNTSLLSLESLGKNDKSAALFSRRLEKFVQIMGLKTGKLVLLGYSRGTPLALEMLSQASKAPSHPTWLPLVKGLVSLGGVIYGSDLADEAVNAGGLSPAPAAARQYSLLAELGNGLQTTEGHALKGKVALENTARWARFLSGMAGTLGGSQGGGSPSHDLATFRKLNFSNEMNQVISFGFKSFALGNPILGYDKNILRFKALASAVGDSVKELTTQGRLDWWKQAKLPSSIKYYSIAATMTSDSSDPLAHELATSPLSTNSELLDDKMLITNHEHFKEISGFALNDSQVAVQKARFWNELNASLNPSMGPLDINLLGILGVHHWGLALRVVNEAKESQVQNPYNPFPRTAMMKAVGALIARDLAE